MAETQPYHYQYPYQGCTQGGGRNECAGRHCVRPGCEYLERAAFNRFEPPPPPVGSTAVVQRGVQRCGGVGDLFYTQAVGSGMGLPKFLQTTHQFQSSQAFSASRVRYPTL